MVSEMKNRPYGIIGRIRIAEEYIGEIKDRMGRASVKYKAFQATKHSGNWRPKREKGMKKIIWRNSSHFLLNSILKKYYKQTDSRN